MVEINTFWSFIVVLGFIGWITAAFTFIFQAWDEDDNFHPSRALTWGVIFVVAYAAWVAGLYNA